MKKVFMVVVGLDKEDREKINEDVLYELLASAWINIGIYNPEIDVKQIGEIK